MQLIIKKRTNSLSDIIKLPDCGDIVSIIKRWAIIADINVIAIITVLSVGSNERVDTAIKKISISGINIVI